MTSKHVKFNGSKVFVSTGHAADSPPQAITGITQAVQAVVTSAGHGMEDGDAVYIAGVVGMDELNGGTFLVVDSTTDTFALAGTDSRDYTAYVSGGTLEVYSVGANFCELTSYARNGVAAPTIPTESMCSTTQETDSGLPGFGTLELGFKWYPSGGVQKNLEALKRSGEIALIQLELKTGDIRSQLGRVTNTSEQASNGTIWTGTASIQLTGEPLDVEAV